MLAYHQYNPVTFTQFQLTFMNLTRDTSTTSHWIWKNHLSKFSLKSARGQGVNTLRPGQNGRRYPDDIFKCIFLNENICIPINISLKFVPKGQINNISSLVQIMACRRPMLVNLVTHICATRPQGDNRILVKWIHQNRHIVVFNKCTEHMNTWYIQRWYWTRIGFNTLWEQENQTHIRVVVLDSSLTRFHGV